MASSEKLCLQWNEFPKIVRSSFEDLRTDNNLTDVTLVSSDGKQFEAHKVVLVSTSPFFKEVFKKNKHPHPLLFMKGVKSDNLSAMVEFLYNGEANVDQENLDNFLALADDLRLKGLNGATDEEGGIKDQVPPKVNKPLSNYGQIFKPTTDISKPLFDNEQIMEMENGDKRVSLNTSSNEDLDRQIRLLMEKSENAAGERQKDGKARICKVCGKEGPFNQIRQHIEANHISGFSHYCSVCGVTVKTRHALAIHKARNHNE